MAILKMKRGKKTADVSEFHRDEFEELGWIVIDSDDEPDEVDEEKPAGCQATTNTGKPCSKKAKKGSDFCGIHS